MVYETLNRLKWKGGLEDCEIVIRHRGGAGDKKVIHGKSVTEVKKSYFYYRDSKSNRETYIPLHRVLEIRLGVKVIWKRAGRSKP
jgi:uncharacterized protein (UPF0248 family)